MNITNILAELKSERDRIDHAIAAIESLNISTGRRRGRPAAISTPKMRRRTLSGAARARIAAAQRARWAKVKQAKVSKPARKMSAAGRNRISQAAKRRWAEWRQMQKKPVAKAA